MSVNIKTNAPSIIQLVEAGTIPGFIRYKKFGRASAATINVWSTVWDGNNDYPYKYTNLVSPTVVSTDADDTQDMDIEAVDEDFNYVVQTVTLNGLTPVPLSKAIMQPFRMEGKGAVSLEGQISLKAETVTYALIKNGGDNYNQSQMAIMVVPKGYYGIVTKVGNSLAANNTGEINYRSKSFGEAWKVKRPFDITSQVVPEEVDFFFPEKTILDVRVKPTSNNSAASAWFDIILVEKARFHQLWGQPKRFKLGEVVYHDK